MKTIKHSRQREGIKHYLKDRKDHPTAEQIYDALKLEYPNISLGTVYRNLSLLTELGEVQKVACGDGIVHYDPDTSSHYHFTCKECNTVIDLNIEQKDMINALSASDFNGTIEGHSIYFYGTCEKCKKRH